jgi:FtsP/CotA-like multicopper oxidase with cupredoxin domain
MRFFKRETHKPHVDNTLRLTRRCFVQGVAAAGLVAVTGQSFNRVHAETIPQSPSVLTGTHFDLAIEPHQVNFTGRRVKAIKINGMLPGPTLK